MLSFYTAEVHIYNKVSLKQVKTSSQVQQSQRDRAAGRGGGNFGKIYVEDNILHETLSVP